MDSIIYKRRSVRAYDASRRAGDDEIKEVLKAAMYAPSAMNKQPWEFVVVRNPQTLSKIMEIHPYCASLGDAGTGIVVCGDLKRQHACPDGGYWSVDCSAATENLLLRALETGLATCWCAIYPNKKRMSDFSELLGLPQGIEPFALVILGYPASSPVCPKDRFDERRIHSEKW